MANPVFTFSLVYTSRRSWYRWCRWLYGGWLAGLVSVLYLMAWADSHFSWTLSAEVFERFAQRFWVFFWYQQAFWLLVATPAFAAGSITDDKANGTLQHLLTTDLTSWEIILGKWLALVVQVGLLALSGLPLLVFLGVSLGLPPLFFLVMAADVGMQIGLLAAASLLASVWCRRTPSAIALTYLILAPLGLVLAGLGIIDWLLFPLPFYTTLGPGSVERLILKIIFLTNLCFLCLGMAVWRLRPTYLQQLLLAPLGFALGLALTGLGIVDGLFFPLPFYTTLWPGSVERLILRIIFLTNLCFLCLVMAAWRLRPTYLQQLERAGQVRVGPTAARPPVGHKPLRWKECYVGGRLPPWLWPLALFMLSFLGGLVLLSDYGFFFLGPCLLVMGSWWAVVLASQSISSEREKRTWELLLTTPLEARQLVRGKVWGIMDRFRTALWAYGAAALLVSLWAGVGALLWTALWWGSTWLTIYFAAAVGLECSTRSQSSWRSLLAATAAAALAVFLRLMLLGIPAAAAVPLIFGCFFLGWPLWLVPALVGFLLLGAACVGTVFALLAEAEVRLERAEKEIQERERVPQSQGPIIPVILPTAAIAEQPLAEI